MRALVVDDDRALSTMLELLLRGTGFTVDVASDLAEARRAVEDTRYALLVLDYHLPDGTGVAFTAEFRAARRDTPILMLTAESAVEISVLALDAGVDDFVVKPVRSEVFLARVRALLRRTGADHGEVLVAGNLTLHRLTRAATVGAQSISLTPRELALVEFLLLHRAEPAAREELLRRVFGFDFDPGTNILEVNIRRVREKLANAGWSERIATQRGVGYRIVAASGAADAATDDDTGPSR